MRAVIAGPYIGEFGWELCEFQGHVRTQAAHADKVIVCSAKGREALYADLQPVFLPHKIQGCGECHGMKPCQTPAELRNAHDDLDRRSKHLRGRGWNVQRIVPKGSIRYKHQTFIQFGSAAAAYTRGDVYDIIVHARNRKHAQTHALDVYNWPLDRWSELVAALLKAGYSVAAIGLRNAALLPEGAVDMRNIGLARDMDMLAATRLVLGPSSGPMHLASLCGAPHVVWTEQKNSAVLKMSNRKRYEVGWNPLSTPCCVVDDSKVSIAALLEGVHTMLADPKLGGAERVAKDMAAYWTKRRKQQGKAYVSKEGQNSDNQVQIITPLLTKRLSNRSFALGLDFGCGWGRFIPILAKHCKQVHAVDLVDGFDQHGYDNVQFQQISYPTKIDLPTNSVDLLWSGLVLQHIVSTEWFSDVTAELDRVLKDGALIMILDDNGKAAPHVKQRKLKVFAEALKLQNAQSELVSLDGPDTHQLIVGNRTDPTVGIIGIGILCYEGFQDLARCLKAVQKYTRPPFEIMVFDNSEETSDIKTYVQRYYPNVLYLTEGKNVGCTKSRNIMLRTFRERHPAAGYLAILDQDIEVRANWLDDMLEVMRSYSDCGIAAWPLAHRLKFAPVNGLVAEIPSMCNLHSIEALLQVERRWGGPFDERFFFHKFDSVICQRLNQLGWHTRLVLKYYRPGVTWSKQAGGIVHHHPHHGIRRHSQWRKICSESKRLYRKLAAEEKWSLDPKRLLITPQAIATTRKGLVPIEKKSKAVTPPKSPTGKTVDPKTATVRRSGKTLRELLAERRRQRLRHIKR
ncbi:hypothetical protein LCGC14_0657490 [marine sediment metagenome]|uniref:Methyltransferase type 11 domain-containing protein n=1 Tax=marine sediment metagenome TaxID=412755 RepID=A0A0F9TG92_9ZZZZ